MGRGFGELLIATLGILFGADIKLAGSLSLPIMIVGFMHYSRDGSFAVLKRFVVVMALGSLVGAWLGGLLLGIVPNAALLPMLALILLISSVKVWRHKDAQTSLTGQKQGSTPSFSMPDFACCDGQKEVVTKQLCIAKYQAAQLGKQGLPRDQVVPSMTLLGQPY